MSKMPTLTLEERRLNLERANAARHEQAELKAAMKRGELSLSDALDDERAQRIPVKAFLMSLPGVGASKAERIRRALGIAPRRRVAGLGTRQRKSLIEAERGGWALRVGCR